MSKAPNVEQLADAFLAAFQNAHRAAHNCEWTYAPVPWANYDERTDAVEALMRCGRDLAEAIEPAGLSDTFFELMVTLRRDGRYGDVFSILDGAFPAIPAEVERLRAITSDLVDSLTAREQEVLEALVAAGATSEDTLISRAHIAKAASGSSASNYGQPIANLSRKRLVQTKTGRRGGTWITPVGQERLNGR